VTGGAETIGEVDETVGECIVAVERGVSMSGFDTGGSVAERRFHHHHHTMARTINTTIRRSHDSVVTSSYLLSHL
jgi:hypothetical protein